MASVLLAEPASAAEEETAAAGTDLAELSLEQLMNINVVGASRFEQRASEAPSSVSVVTADEIRKFGYRNLADIIRAQRGFFVTYDRNYAFLGARGVDRSGGYNTRVLILVDGHRTNENLYDTAFLGNEFPLDIDLIDRVEIIRGPGSSLYGDNAFFGVINVISRHRSVEGVEVSAEGGSLDTYKARGTYGKKLPHDGALTISATAFDSKGYRNLYYPEFDTPEQNNGIARNCDYERSGKVFGSLSLGDFTLQGAFSTRTKGVPTASFQSNFNDSRVRTLDDRSYLDLSYNHVFDSGFDVMARAYYDYYYYYENFVYADALDVQNRDEALNKWWGGELKISRQFFDKHRLVFGMDYQSNITQKFSNYDITEPFGRYLDLDRPTSRWASFLQDEFTIRPDLILNAGIRYDRYSTFGDTLNPRLALIYSPFSSTSLKALYGEAFRAPNNFEMYYEVDDFKGNPALRPEKIRTVELVWEQGLGEHVKSTVTGFRNEIRNMIRQDTVGDVLLFQNLNQVTVLGAEAELEGKWRNGLQARASYAYQHAEEDSTGELLVDSPHHMAKLNLIVPCYRDKLFSGLELQYMSKRRTLADNQAGGFLLTNLTLFSQNVLPGLEVSGSIYNLFDKRYSDPGSKDHKQDAIQQDGRLFRVKATYRF